MTTRLGLHVFPGARKGFAEVCAANPAVIAFSGSPRAVNEAQSIISKETITIYRDTSVYDGLPPGAGSLTEAAAITAAELYWPQLREIYEEIPADYYQPIQAAPTDDASFLAGLVSYEERLLELADRDGYHLAIGSLAAGAPFTWRLWRELVVPLIERAADGGHIYCRQAFGGIVLGSSGQLTKDAQEPADDITARPFREATYLRRQSITTPMVVVAAGQNGGILFPNVQEFVTDVQAYDRLCQEHDNIWGFCCWTYGRRKHLPINMERASKALAQYLIDKGGAKRPDYPEVGTYATSGNRAEPPRIPGETGTPDAKFVKFETEANLSSLAEGDEFSARWRLKNNGQIAWNSDFQVIPIESDLTEGQGRFSLREVAATPIRPGQEANITLQFTAPNARFDPYRIVWRLADSQGQPFGTRFWLRFVVVTGGRIRLEPIHLATGMNINPDAPHSNPMKAGSLRGLDWVRFPFKAADKDRNISESFGEYDAIIQGYAQQGTGSLIVLNQQTVAGKRAPWKKRGQSWSAYAGRFAEAAGEIAAHYADIVPKVAFEIWNEGDNPKTPHVSVYVPPEDFALLLGKAAEAIREKAPESPIIMGGLSTGPELASEYVSLVRKASKGRLPVEAVGLHPYGRWPVKRPIPGWGYGDLDKVFTIFRRRLPGIRLWITEIGIVGRRKPIADEYLPAVANYMKDLYRLVAQEHSNQVRVVIWFAWSDRMENAGIVDRDGNPKESLMKAFSAVKDRTLKGLKRS